MRLVPALLVFLSAIPLPAQTLPGGAQPPAVAAEPAETAPIRAIQAEPALRAGAVVTLHGEVVRTSRRTEGGRTTGSFLLRDVHGDTIAVDPGADLPQVGAEVRVVGAVSVRPGGSAVIAGPVPPVSVVVLRQPASPLTPPERGAEAEGSAAASACGSAEGMQRIACAAGEHGGLIAAGVGAVALLLVAGSIVMRRREEADPSIPLIVDLGARPPAPSAHAPVAAPAPAPAPAATPPAPAPPPAAPPAAPVPAAEAPEAAPVAPAVPPPPPFAEPHPGEATPAPTNGRIAVPRIVGAVARPEPVAPPLPMVDEDDLVQLLPGKLEVLEGTGLDAEIRFFRVSSRETPEITFGRAEGPPYRHVRLVAPTVSRVHARLRFEDRRWRIQNLSQINPVTVNGNQVEGPDQERALEDGDQIRIGEILFRFHARSH